MKSVLNYICPIAEEGKLYPLSALQEGSVIVWNTKHNYAVSLLRYPRYQIIKFNPNKRIVLLINVATNRPGWSFMDTVAYYSGNNTITEKMIELVDAYAAAHSSSLV